MEWLGREILGKEAEKESLEGLEENKDLGCDRLEGMGEKE